MPIQTYLINQQQLQNILNVVSRLSSPNVPMGDVVGMVDMLRQLPEHKVEPKEEPKMPRMRWRRSAK